jgi:hypothetical protein
LLDVNPVKSIKWRAPKLKIFNGGCYGLVTAGAACAMPEA